MVFLKYVEMLLIGFCCYFRWCEGEESVFLEFLRLNTSEGIIKDSLSSKFWDIDMDDTGYWTVEELIPSIKFLPPFPSSDAEALEKAIRYVKTLDYNQDDVVDMHEVRESLHSSGFKILLGKDFFDWMDTFRGENSQTLPVSLIHIHRLFDEDLNGKLTWKEVRMVAVMAELLNLSEKPMLDENFSLHDASESSLNGLKSQYQDRKWISGEELEEVLRKLSIDSFSKFHWWMTKFLASTSCPSFPANSSTWKTFHQLDADSSGLITKGELIAALHSHRKNYYNEARINRRWSRADRNQDGVITFPEYAFLESLKHPGMVEQYLVSCI